jgi:hypothetical protein
LNLLAIDPGGVTGWAYFQQTRLALCGFWPLEKALSSWCVPPGSVDVVLVERPQIYRGEKKKTAAPDADIITLAVRAGQLAGRYLGGGARSVEYVLPHGWKGNLPKPKAGETYIVQKRVLAVLEEEEKRLIYSSMSARAKKPDHNMIDAIGIGLWRLERKYCGEAEYVRSP